MPNRLARETSPYLLQHAENPVDWHPWGDEAFETARREGKPILLSVGYSACHWCHVMERESFEDEEIARVMNERFVSVKVDREERPDVDEIYMNAVQILTGRGGWPMTVFLTPDGEPFYGGTYYPPEDRQGMPGFRRLLVAISEAYREKPESVRDTAAKLVTAIEALQQRTATDDPLEPGLVTKAAEELSRAYDSRYGGLGGAPKFPNGSAFDLFLRAHDATGKRELLDMTVHTLRQMARGGIYDHLGGGFHRYSVDARWLVPHFEKMLYDNALLARLYVDAHRASGDEELLRVALDVLRYVEREMTGPDGGFHATQDADSEGEEGKFFVWTPEEVRSVLGEDDAEIISRVYDVTDVGNFEGKNILHRTLDDEQAGKMFGRSPEEIATLLRSAREKLFAARERRPKPFRDEKVLLCWNGLMLSAFAHAHRVTGDSSLLATAERTVCFLEENLRRDGAWLHSWKDGVAKIPAFLDDVAAMGLASLDLLGASFDPAHLDRAEAIGNEILERFADPAGGFFYATDAHDRLLLRPKSAFDGSVPSGTALATHFLLRLDAHLDDARFREKAVETLRLHRESMTTNAFAHAALLGALDFHARGATEIVVLARAGDGRDLLDEAAARLLPNGEVFAFDPETPPARLPVFARDKTPVDGRATAYVCRGFTCSAPVTTREALREAIEGGA